MCTVTFIPRRAGFCLAMNRDEQLTRPMALRPRTAIIGGRRVICPTEPGGGTWIALNDRGNCLALINWYSVSRRAGPGAVTRGRIVQSARVADTSRAVEAALGSLPLERVNPFRLIGVFPATREVCEWRWDLHELTRAGHGWQSRQWNSSGFDEPTAQRLRSRAFRAALCQGSVGTLAWLRRLHRSHAPQCGPFSTCMHRADAATVSFTEVCVTRQRATMRYWPGSPCQTARRSSRPWATRALVVLERTADADPVP